MIVRYTCDSCDTQNFLFLDWYNYTYRILIKRTVLLISAIACILFEVTMALDYTEHEMSQYKEANVICLPQQSGTVYYSKFSKLRSLFKDIFIVNSFSLLSQSVEGSYILTIK